MARRSGWLTALAVIGALVLACEQRQTQVSTQDDAKLLSVIEAALQETWLGRQAEESSDGALLDVPSIREVFRAPAQHEAAARAVIADPHASADAKRVAVLVMQCLSPGEYVDFLRFTFENVRKGRCPESVLSKAIFPGEEWGSVVAENYQQEDVRELLLEIKASSVGGDVVQAKIESILDGHTAAYLKHLRETGAAVPAIGCTEPSRPSR